MMTALVIVNFIVVVLMAIKLWPKNTTTKDGGTFK